MNSAFQQCCDTVHTANVDQESTSSKVGFAKAIYNLPFWGKRHVDQPRRATSSSRESTSLATSHVALFHGLLSALRVLSSLYE
jgi:hypothetical protein